MSVEYLRREIMSKFDTANDSEKQSFNSMLTALSNSPSQETLDNIQTQLNGGDITFGGRRPIGGSKKSHGKRHGNASLRAWVTFVKKVQKEEGVGYKEAMTLAKKRKDGGEKWRGGGDDDEIDPSSMSEQMGGRRRRRRTHKRRGSKKRCGSKKRRHSRRH